jgi:hypothetical protein
MEKDYTREAQMAAEAYVKAHPHFHGPITSMDDDADFSLREAADLIKTAAAERQQALQRIEAQRGSQEALAQAREDISLLPDREAEKVRHDWLEQASAQASRYCLSRNAGASPKSFDPNDKEQAGIRSGVLSWIKRTKMRGGLGGRKALDKN